MWTLAAVALWIGVWQLASVLVGSRILLAGPWDTLVRLAALLPTGSFWATVFGSFGRIALGFFVGFALALVLGWLSVRFEVVGRLLGPAVSALKSIPLVCIIVLLLMWVGSRRVSAIAVFLVVFPAVYFSVVEGLRARDHKLGELFQVFGVGRMRAFLADSWQQLLPYLVATSRNVCGMAWKSGVAAEVIGSPRGTIGEQVYQSKLLLATADLFAWTIVVVVASWICEKVFVAVLQATGPGALRLALRTRRGALGREKLRGSFSHSGSGGELTLSGVTIGYPDGTVVGRNLNLSLRRGERVVLASESGSGKTTLIRTVCGLLPPLAGVVRTPSKMSLVWQEARLVERLSAEKNVELVAGCSEEVARELLLELLPEDALGKPVCELSGGQRRRVELVRALAYPSDAVILDEPFASLDDATHRRAAAFVLRHLQGRTLLVASHAPGEVELLQAKAQVEL